MKVEFLKIENQPLVAFTAFHIGYVQFQLWTIGKVSFDVVHQSLTAAQQLADEKRSDLSALR